LAAGNTPDPYVLRLVAVSEEIADWQFCGQVRAMGVITTDESQARSRYPPETSS
jgi:hypothetical protein